MTSRLVRRIALSLLLLLPAASAHAFWDPPFITPASPTPIDQVAINVYLGDCDAIFVWPGYPQVTRIGNQIHLVVFGQHWDGGELCNFPRGTPGFYLGTFEPGDYTVTVDLDFVDFFGMPQVETLGVVPFDVTRATRQASVPVPTAGAATGALLVLGLLTIGFRCIRQLRVH